ncbi:PIN domain-containing protein [Biomaibacter acetigenes]|jgi:hypothetical protein|uniref:Ribonuclease VapC n=1 Tax=Biomaibacter acetigenes TaxID=2316383 RepID=A0A3G2R714_9FIRM|nr:PIN domain-containing protein [Biomaibacter acetigenes]AYO31344.1 PIN domain-containing protein [Biomaibacter acetigenes]MDN5313167.1 hypothetical protein [Thermoanaerobacteraceae bacterium]RKL61734.1 PIN domain-containing protein [Thermoanaerobacteraceae bacterium SP2]
MKNLTGKVLIDTSIWIEYFRGNSEITNIVDLLIDEDRAVIVGPVISELIQGVKDKTKAEELITNIKALPYIDIRKSDWIDIGLFSFRLRKKGLTIPFTDTIIAAVAIKYHLSMYSIDKHFDYIEELLKFQGNK